MTPEAINFMARYARGLICLSLGPSLVDKLELPLMTQRNGSRFGTNFTVSIEARSGVTTGISAADRAHTIQVAVADDARPGDLVTPGHVFPLRAQPGGVLTRAGQTEGSVDLALLAGLKPAAVICEIMKDDGTMARMPDLEAFAEEHGLKIAAVRDLIRYHLRLGQLGVRRVAETKLPSRFGNFTMIAYENDISPDTHVAIVKGDVSEKGGPDPVLVRVHSECLTGDAFGSLRCEVLLTPGHTPGSVSIRFPDLNAVMTGDLLFYHSVGRTDFPGSSQDALRKSLHKKIFILPQETAVYPGHGPNTNVGEELANNPYLWL